MCRVTVTSKPAWLPIHPANASQKAATQKKEGTQKHRSAELGSDGSELVLLAGAKIASEHLSGRQGACPNCFTNQGEHLGMALPSQRPVQGSQTKDKDT